MDQAIGGAPAGAPEVHAAAFEVVREFDRSARRARRRSAGWTEPDDLELIPANEAAAKVAVFCDAARVTLLVGPRGHSHELSWWIVTATGQHQLRACLEAVVDGRYRRAPRRYRENASPGPGEEDPPPERRFAPYA